MHYQEGNPAELREKFWKELAGSPFVMLQLDNDQDSAAPMTAQLDQDANHELWFFTRRDGHFAKLGPATATFAAKGHNLFARFHGVLTEEPSRARRAEHWSNIVEAWFPGGEDDSDLLMLRMELGDASIWDSDLGLVGTAKMFLGLDAREDAERNQVETVL
ncbi:MAG: pyridoxamine 5'-phosphate oxidase family protein [Novosphingobium sp.]